MRDFAKVSPKIWISERGKQLKRLGCKAQLIAFYLSTNPHASMIGIYYLPIAFISHETGIAYEEVINVLKQLIEIGYCSYDEQSEYIWVHEMGFEQIDVKLKLSDHRVKHVNDLFDALPELSFLKKFLEKYAEPFHITCKESEIRGLEAPSKPLPSKEKEKEVFLEISGKFSRHIVPELEMGLLETLAALIAEYNDKTFPSPLLSGRLPTGERVQFVMSPACEKDKIVCSIRRHQMRTMTLNDYKENGAFDDLIHIENIAQNVDDKLRELFQQKNYLHFIELAIQSRKNILISGGTGTGKTTFLNACLRCIPGTERLITVEDTREVIVDHPNAAQLLFNEEDESITSLNIFKACLRLRPDRIFLSELRGKEVWPYLRAANSGHPGSLSTVHADSPEGAFTQLVFMMQQAGSTSSEEQIRNYVKSIIHIVIQLKRDTNSGRFMQVSEVWYRNEKTK